MAASGFRLSMQQGPRPGQIFDLNKPVIIIGRESDNDIVLEDPQVSRHHARLSEQAGGYVVEDLGSTNGTFLNGRRITSATPISPGDTLGLGDTVAFKVEAAEVGAGETMVGRPQEPVTPPPPPIVPPPSFGPTTPPPMAPPPPSYAPPPPAPAFTPPPPPPAQPVRRGPSCWVWGCGLLVLIFL